MIEPVVVIEKENNITFILGGDDEEVVQDQRPKPRKDFKQIFSRKPKKDKERRNKRDRHPVSGYDTVLNE